VFLRTFGPKDAGLPCLRPVAGFDVRGAIITEKSYNLHNYARSNLGHLVGQNRTIVVQMAKPSDDLTGCRDSNYDEYLFVIDFLCSSIES
jgi:hypothetical protein